MSLEALAKNKYSECLPIRIRQWLAHYVQGFMQVGNLYSVRR
jgi:hypothetical protein